MQAKQSARNNWLLWRLVMEEKLSYTEASQMSMDMLQEANAALDLYIEKVDQAMKKNKG